MKPQKRKPKHIFEKAFSSMNFTEKEISALSELAVNAGFLMGLAFTDLRQLTSVASIEDYLKEAAEFNYTKCKLASFRLLTKLRIAKGSKGFDLLKDVSEGKPCNIFSLTAEAGLDDSEFNKILYEVKPHLLTVLQPSNKITMSSTVMSKAFRESCANT